MRYILLLMVLCLACDQPRHYEVQEPTAQPDYYIRLLKEVNSQVDKNPKDEDLIYRKLYIGQKLRWPEDVSDEISHLIKKRSFDFELYHYATDFYQSTHHYEKLLGVLDKWNESYPVSLNDIRLRIIAFNGLKREMEARNLLWQLLQKSDNPEHLAFIGSEYIAMEDTARAAYAFSLLARQDPQHSVLLNVYVPLLISQGYPERARDLLLAQGDESETFEKRFFLAKALFQIGEEQKAIDLMRESDNTVGDLQIASWYRDLKDWDSAIFYIDKVLQQDSTREAYFVKATILEDRGWLNSAYSMFSTLVSLDSADSISQNRVEIVGRKIAYLRKLREAEKRIPVLEIPSLKSTENE